MEYAISRITSTDELYHYGVKGMKWGIRRYQNKDGSLTNAGKNKYQNESDKSTNRSSHRSRIESKYISKGMSPKQAKMAADRRIKTEKIIAITAGITVASIAAYATNKYIKDYCDKTIKSGKLLQRVEMKDTGGKLYDNFYASYKKSDNIKYTGKLGRERYQQTGKAYTMSLLVKDDVKVASKNNAKKVFKDLYKNDKKFAEYVHNLPSSISSNEKPIRFAKLGTYTDGELSKLYENFNSKLAGNHDSYSSKTFYSAMKSKGYNAIQDINDMKFNDYKTKNPLIVFDAKGKVSVTNFRELTVAEISKNLDQAKKIQKAEDYVNKIITGSKKGATYALGATVPVGVSYAFNTKAINNYRKQHPNTKLSDREIIGMLYGNT